MRLLIALIPLCGLMGCTVSDEDMAAPKAQQAAKAEAPAAEPLVIPLRDGTTLAGNLFKGGDDVRPVIMMRGSGPHFHSWTKWKRDRWHQLGYHCVGVDYRPSRGATGRW